MQVKQECMQDYKISIIVPVYNTSAYLSKCLDSILKQTLEYIEVICVNDGSTDNSLEILRAYEKVDDRIKVIEKTNGGLVSARKAGVAVARGEYIGFVDSDDWVESEMFEKLYEAALKNDADIVASGHILEGNYISKVYDSVDAGSYCTGARMQELRGRMILDLIKKDKGVGGSLCTKIVRRDILRWVIKNIPDEITLSEDKVTTISLLLECSSAVVLREAYYHYVLRSGSMTQEGNTDYLLKVHLVYEYLSSLYSHPNFIPEMRLQAELYIVQMLIKGINTRMGFSVRNLMWIDPYWLDKIPAGSRVVLYGAGDLGRIYYTQLKNFGRHQFVGCIDENFAKMKDNPFAVDSPEKMSGWFYDWVVITIKDANKVQDITQKLIASGVAETKILWFEQPEIFWRFAEAMGLLKNGEK